MRSQIFIGSSKEGLEYTDIVKDTLEPVGECVIWTNSFTRNKSNLDNLVKKTKLSNFAVLIATVDDVTLKRDELKSTPRDNIIFEYGLFTGATGVDHSFLLVHQQAELPSDLDGISVYRFSDDVKAHNSLLKVCQEIAQAIKEMEQKSQLGLLPSTALALGYFYSFIKPVCEHVKQHSAISSSNGNLKLKDFQLHIMIPKNLDSSGVNDFKNEFTRIHALENARTIAVGAGRDYPFHFKIDPADQDITGDIEVKIYDVPTTLNTIQEAIKLYLPSDSVGPDRDAEYLKDRELYNFSKALQHLVRTHQITKSNVHINDDLIL